MAAFRAAQGANALVLLDDRWSCQDVAGALVLDDDTVRNWHKLFEQRGIEGLIRSDVGGRVNFEPLKLSQKPFCLGLPGTQTMPASARRTVLA